MPLDLQKLAATANRIGRDVAGDAYEAVTIRLDPTTAWDPITETDTTTWGFEESGIEALGYEKREERQQNEDAERRVRTWLVTRDLLPGFSAEPGQEGQIVSPATGTWHLYRVDLDPSGSVIQLHSRQ